ncbi:hypothetical protein [Acidovorax delafieldii]|uniref:hypothetical protein n=1 Tax=Acidovorax delafieldii TaxID=47920 RepID=UPI003ED16E85
MTQRIEILENGVVVGTIIADEDAAEQLYPGAWRLAEQQEDPAPPPDLRITRLAFLDRFTDAEAVAIDLASIGATVQAAGLRRYLHKVNSAQHIDLARADLQTGVQALEAAGLLAAGRAQQILTAPITDIERYKGS